jgi:hypothetical protein
MDTITGTWINGRIVPDTTPDWPEGTRVEIEPAPKDAPEIGMREEDWDDSPEGIEAWLRWYYSLEPLEFTPEEEARMAEWRRLVKEREILDVKRTERLFS